MTYLENRINFWVKKPAQVKAADVVQKASVTDKKASQAAQVRLDNVAQPGRFSRTLSWAKNSLAGIGYALLRKLNKDSSELYKAVKNFDNLNPRSNKYLTAKRRYDQAVRQIEEDVVKIYSKDKRSLIQKIASNASDKHFRIYTEDKKYGFDVRNEYTKYGISRSEAKTDGVTFEEFVGKIVEKHENQIKKSYDASLDKASQELVAIYKSNVGQSQKLAHKRNKAILDLASQKAYRNVLAKDFDSVSKDIDAAVVKKLGNVKAMIKDIENQMNDKIGFWNSLGAYRKELNKAFKPQYDAKNNDIRNLQKELKKLEDADKALKKQWENLHKIAHDETETKARIAQAKNLVSKNEREMKKVQSKIEDFKKQIEQLKIDQAKEDSLLAVRATKDLNARRNALGRLIGENPEDLKTPENPTTKEIWARRAKKGLIYGGIYGGLAGGFVATEYYLGWPATNGAIKLAKDGYGKYSNWKNPIHKLYNPVDNYPKGFGYTPEEQKLCKNGAESLNPNYYQATQPTLKDFSKNKNQVNATSQPKTLNNNKTLDNNKTLNNNKTLDNNKTLNNNKTLDNNVINVQDENSIVLYVPKNNQGTLKRIADWVSRAWVSRALSKYESKNNDKSSEIKVV